MKHLLLRLAVPGHGVELNLVVQLSALTFFLIPGSLGSVLGKFGENGLFEKHESVKVREGYVKRFVKGNTFMNYRGQE